MKSKGYAELESGSVHISDMKVLLEDLTSLTEKNICNYAAILSLDLRKRSIKPTDPVVVMVYGDNLAHAITEFIQTDEASGLYDTDFNPEMISVLFQATL